MKLIRTQVVTVNHFATEVTSATAIFYVAADRRDGAAGTRERPFDASARARLAPSEPAKSGLTGHAAIGPRRHSLP